MEAKAADQPGRDHHDEERPGARERGGEPARQAEALEHARQFAANQEQQNNSGEPKDRGDAVDGADRHRNGIERVAEIQIARHGQAEQVLHLAQRDDQRGCAGEARHHGVAQIIRDEAGARQPEREQNESHLERDDEGALEIGGRPFCDVVAKRRRHHEGRHGDRPDRERSARAEDRIDDGRRHAGIEANLGRQAGEHGIGHGLRHQHDGDNDAG